MQFNYKNGKSETTMIIISVKQLFGTAKSGQLKWSDLANNGPHFFTFRYNLQLT